MQCPRCHAENREGRRFCGECGLSFASACPSCGFLNEGSEKFCGSCGRALIPAPTTAEARFGSSQVHIPKHLAEKILTSRAALEGERKQVTVLFADLKGSMELLADRDPEEARRLLDPVLERMIEAVHRYEGTVNQVMGDGIMALFGAPLAHEDHAVRACYAALRMQASVKRYAEEVFRSHGVPLQIRVGLNSGDVVVRAIGGDLRMDYTAVGQTTHLAARMEQMANPGGILLAPSTLALVEGYIAVKSLGPVPVKGLADAVEVYEVTGAGPARTRLQAVARRGLTRFVGRDAELEQLRRAQRLAGAGHGQVAAVVGEAGVGKSRLVYEFTHSHRLQDWVVLESASVSYGKATSYLPVIDLLKGYCKVQDRDELREVREKVTGKLLTLDRSLEPTLPALLALLDVPVDDAEWQTLDPGPRRQRTLDALKRLLLREARQQPLLLIFEDLHWIDGETQALLDALVESLGSARLLLLVNYRPEYQHAWGSKTYYGQLRLDALPVESAGELLDALLGEDPGLAPLKQLLVKRGNPFFLEEAVRTLAETKALAGERGRYRLTQPVQTIQVPATVQTMLAARIDRLSPEDKRLLQVASVVGKDAPFALLQAITEVPDETLRPGLDRLQAAEFLYETGLYPDLEYSFKHALTHDVTYGGLLQERRREMHTRIVEAIERLHRDRLGEHVERLAHHASRGEVWEKAATYSGDAGARAFARSANREAVAWYEQALTAIRHLPETDEVIARRIDFNFDIRNAAIQTGQASSVVDLLREAEALAHTLGDKQRLGRALDYLSNLLATAGEPTEAVTHAERAAAIAFELGDFGLGVAARFHLGAAYHALGQYARAAELLATTIASLEGDAARERYGLAVPPSILIRVWLVWSLGELGRFAEARRYAQEALRFADASNRRLDLSYACRVIGFAPLRQGAIDEAIPPFERGLALSESEDLAIGIPYYASCLGYAYLLAGRVADALPLLERALMRRGGGFVRLLPSCLAWLAEAYLIAGRAAEASGTATEALGHARAYRQEGDEAYVLWVLGNIAARHQASDVPAAESRYREALTLACALGMRPLVAHCHLGLGKLYGRTGKQDQASEHLTTATTMYREMGMTYWLEKAEAELKD